jgi:hypothetical protein
MGFRPTLPFVGRLSRRYRPESESADESLVSFALAVAVVLAGSLVARSRQLAADTHFAFRLSASGLEA